MNLLRLVALPCVIANTALAVIAFYADMFVMLGFGVVGTALGLYGLWLLRES